MNKFDIYEWIKKVIDSCLDFHQWAKCIKLIQRFEIMFKQEEDRLLSSALRSHHHYKLKLLHPDKNE